MVDSEWWQAQGRTMVCHHGCVPGARERGQYLRPIPGSRKRMGSNTQLLSCQNAALKIDTLHCSRCGTARLIGGDERPIRGLIFFNKLWENRLNSPRNVDAIIGYWQTQSLDVAWSTGKTEFVNIFRTKQMALPKGPPRRGHQFDVYKADSQPTETTRRFG